VKWEKGEAFAADENQEATNIHRWLDNWKKAGAVTLSSGALGLIPATILVDFACKTGGAVRSYCSQWLTDRLRAADCAVPWSLVSRSIQRDAPTEHRYGLHSWILLLSRSFFQLQ
jgi:hypothetical protein